MNQSLLPALRLRFGVLVVLLTLTAACASSNPSAASPTASSGGNAVAAAGTPGGASAAAPAVNPTVNMTDALRFEPATLTVPKGTVVTWRNSSATMHTVTDDPGKAANKADAALPSGAQPWDSGNLDPGKTFQHAFDTPGTYKYFCTPHEAAGMVATIVVTG